MASSVCPVLDRERLELDLDILFVRDGVVVVLDSPEFMGIYSVNKSEKERGGEEAVDVQSVAQSSLGSLRGSIQVWRACGRRSPQSQSHTFWRGVRRERCQALRTAKAKKEKAIRTEKPLGRRQR